jgi:5'-nucleotidase
VTNASAIILVDMDGVLSDLEKAFFARWAFLYPDYPIPNAAGRRAMKLREFFPDQYAKEVDGILREEGFYASLPPVPGALVGIQEMADSGLDVWICTRPLSVYQHCVPEKYAWVEQHLGHEWTKRIIMARNKRLVRGRYLIDDAPEIEGDGKPLWKHIIFDAPYNQHVSHLQRMTWACWRDVIVDDKL